MFFWTSESLFFWKLHLHLVRFIFTWTYGSGTLLLLSFYPVHIYVSTAWLQVPWIIAKSLTGTKTIVITRCPSWPWRPAMRLSWKYQKRNKVKKGHEVVPERMPVKASQSHFYEKAERLKIRFIFGFFRMLIILKQSKFSFTVYKYGTDHKSVWNIDHYVYIHAILAC